MRMTKAQLVDENIALRHNISLLEQQLASLRAAQRPAQPGDEVVVATYTKRDGYNTFAHRPAN